ncbi:hypothetical protein K2173_019558 [Erythroxylum novogranatense]|uniref:Reverse transcriptase Ty1/copia-type domain-containing protein n=1 Tax=Erythroxylum novogranatense TaxID=1862640 RepID=A0AAV8UBQ5_9ROSI|nr:hypothetical protein K2173_019558 [Erythroxylum novogranatense]
MKRKFEMTDLGLLHYFLGLEIQQSEDGIFISQKKYATDLLERFNMLNCKVAATPMNVNEILKLEDGTATADARAFRSLVGGLIYLTHTRPDISFSVGTVDFGIWYTHVSKFKLIGFTDSDWAGSLDDRKSTSGSVFSLGSGAISWSSKKQATTALSSSEAEYVAASSAACQAAWLRRLLEDLQQKQEEARCDQL